MKPILVGAVATLVVGSAIAAPFILVLLVLLAPLVMLAMASGWEVVRGGNRSTARGRPAINDRHVVTPGRPR